MAALKLLLSQARRQCLAKNQSTLHSPPFLCLQRSFSSDSNSEPSPEAPPYNAPRRPSEPVPIQPVSYAVKPKEPNPTAEIENPQSQAQQSEHQQQQTLPPRRPRDLPSQETRTAWTREDVRYVKDVPSIAPVSYPLRVAPLPEDKASDSVEESVKEESEEMLRERRRVDARERGRRAFRIAEAEEKVVVPFPTLVKSEKKEGRQVFDLMDAIHEVKANAKSNFVETVEAHVRLGIDKSRSDLIVRGTMKLPHGSQKVIRVAVFAEGADADEARAAGADIVGSDEFIEEIANGGKIDFDECYATPQIMRRLFKISKTLNSLGLMPNNKQGTVTRDVATAVKRAKEGHIQFKMDRTAIVHVGVGKVNLSEDHLRQNIGAFMNALLQAKPAGLKKTSKYAGYVNSFHICSTLGPGYSISIQSLSKAVDHYTKKLI
ncbi:Ribosomal protein L1p/L10e family putative isoform 1 [Tripterygium wilfordii]|uniref:Large ribosomal subunit protein uL1c n=1 Tax=Tripterygium wilfordii TaxID=458696 RepID=A0A7J7CEH9_TRIWF|nr:50S ribosomal protein L1 [Tripterygium wilfordii]KAF5732548.1 Ribosomal protein L1p/L10e family putative isoform 1 [Tripterygium wilfordii]